MSADAGSGAADPRRTFDMSRVLDGGVPALPTSSSVSRTPADPPPLVERHQWVFDLRWDRGDVYLLNIQSNEEQSPRVTPRVMGRFALELFEGPALLERVRFDFPLLGVPEADASFRAPPSLSSKLRTRIGVMFPATSRGTRLELWDRATDRRWALPWPPSLPSAAAASDAGVPAP